MIKSSVGNGLVITIGGGSHEREMTLKMTGVPAGYTIRGNKVNEVLAARAPGKSPLSTPRKERDLPYLKVNDQWVAVNDQFEFITPEDGVLEFIIRNENYTSEVYHLELPRPGHADLPAFLKYGNKVNMAGGGPFSGRMTAMYTLAGAVAMEILKTMGIKVGTSVMSVGDCVGEPVDLLDPAGTAHGLTEAMKEEILKAKAEKDSVGGVVEGYATGLPVGIGGPMFDGFESLLSPLLLGIPGVKALEFGAGFKVASMKGSQDNDDFIEFNNKKIITETNNAGGILGGITTGMPLVFRVAFKATPSISKVQNTVCISTGEQDSMIIMGRHDPCIVPRGRAVVGAVTAIGILDGMILGGLIGDNSSCSEEESGFSSNQSDASRELQKLRDDIDAIDQQIVSLLNQRMEAAKGVAVYKIVHGVAIKDSGREDEILAKVGDRYKDIYQEIFQASRKLQQEITDKIKKSSQN